MDRVGSVLLQSFLVHHICTSGPTDGAYRCLRDELIMRYEASLSTPIIITRGSLVQTPHRTRIYVLLIHNRLIHYSLVLIPAAVGRLSPGAVVVCRRRGSCLRWLQASAAPGPDRSSYHHQHAAACATYSIEQTGARAPPRVRTYPTYVACTCVFTFACTFICCLY